MVVKGGGGGLMSEEPLYMAVVWLVIKLSRSLSMFNVGIDACITRRKAQGPSRTCNESKEEEESSLALYVGTDGTTWWPCWF